MKLKSKTTSLSLRLVTLVAASLLGQQALAVGTEAGTSIANTASVDYFVGGIDQTDVPSNTVTFVVDRRVSLELVPTSTPDLLTVAPGQDDAFVDFLLSNTSNSDLDFDLVVANLLSGNEVDLTGSDDDADMNDPRIAVFTDFESGSPVAPAIPASGTTTATIDNLPSDDSIRIRVWGNADLALVDGAVAGLDVTATALADDGSALAYGEVNDDGLQNVDVNSNNGIVVRNDGFLVAAADLSVAKAWSVIDDPLASDLAIPGARLQYEIVVSNGTGAADATNVVITDAIDGTLTFLTNALGSDFVDIQIDDGTGPVDCTAADTDSDGCEVAGGVLTVGDPVNRVINIAADGTYTVRFQVEIPNPALTP